MKYSNIINKINSFYLLATASEEDFELLTEEERHKAIRSKIKSLMGKPLTEDEQKLLDIYLKQNPIYNHPKRDISLFRKKIGL
jgi:hypothetical protein